jgi:hypothetical protein
VLKIVKSGFKHAFLPKREVQILLHAVESRVSDLLEESTMGSNPAAETECSRWMFITGLLRGPVRRGR